MTNNPAVPSRRMASHEARTLRLGGSGLYTAARPCLSLPTLDQRLRHCAMRLGTGRRSCGQHRDNGYTRRHDCYGVWYAQSPHAARAAGKALQGPLGADTDRADTAGAVSLSATRTLQPVEPLTAHGRWEQKKVCMVTQVASSNMELGAKSLKVPG